ncbi:MAG: thioredoxin-disulfide reductase [Acetilactobacillus jinshanensis]
MKKFDVVIIGAGPGGMTSALYASRANLSVLMLDRGLYGGQMNNTAAVENYTGFKSVMGPDLAKDMYKSSTQFGAKYAYGVVKSIEDHGRYKIVHTDSGDYQATVVIIATGSKNRKLQVPGEDKYAGKGVSYCAVCDGNFFRNKKVIVVGGGDSAVSEGLYLSHLVAQVVVIHRRDQLRAEKIYQRRAFANPKMKFVWNTNVTEIEGNGMKVTGVKDVNNQTKQTGEIKADGIFIYIGNVPMTSQFKNLKITDDQGWIKTNDQMETRIPGIFAIGDVREKRLRQIATAVGDGGIAGQNAYEYIQSLNDSEN